MKTEMRAKLQNREDPDYFYSLMFDRDDLAVDADTFWIYSKVIEYIGPMYGINEKAPQFANWLCSTCGLSNGQNSGRDAK